MQNNPIVVNDAGKRCGDVQAVDGIRPSPLPCVSSVVDEHPRMRPWNQDWSKWNAK